MKHMDFFKKAVEDKKKIEIAQPILFSAAMAKKERCPLHRESFHMVDQPYNADMLVYFTKKEAEADLLVYVSNYSRRAKGRPEVWYYSNTAYHADTKIFPVAKPFMADLIVCIVEQEYRARWLRKKKIKLNKRRFGS